MTFPPRMDYSCEILIGRALGTQAFFSLLSGGKASFRWRGAAKLASGFRSPQNAQRAAGGLRRARGRAV